MDKHIIRPKKHIFISIPCWNEEKNIPELINSIEEQFQIYLPNYEYTIQFIDNCSTDNTRNILREIVQSNSHVRAIFNVSNVSGSAIHGILQTDGDCCIHMTCDFQDPPTLIPKLVKQWEKGKIVVCAVKHTSSEKKMMWRIRSLYYWIVKKFSSIPQIEHFTGFGLYDKKFIEIIRRVEDPLITLRGIVAEYTHAAAVVYFDQPLRKYGKSKKNILRYYDYAMRSITTYTKIGIHAITIGGVIIFLLSGIFGVVFLGMAIWGGINQFGIAIAISFILLLYSTLLIAIGIIGSYIVNINVRLLKRPLAIEEERIGIWEDLQPKAENISPYESFSIISKD